MIHVPAHLLCQYKTFIAHKEVSPKEQQYYIKWMRFFLDFFHKYQSGTEANTSLTAFMEKLREKKQSEKQIKQAHHAIMLYSELVSRAKEKSTNSPLPKNKKYIKKTNRWMGIPFSRMIMRQQKKCSNQVGLTGLLFSVG